MAYDIGETFQRIEEEMISSMARNLKGHRLKEKAEDLNYTQWQAEELLALREFRENNEKVFGGYFSTINDKIEAVLREAYADGEMEQEAQILEAIKNGWKVPRNGQGIQGTFFKINERKLNALLNEVNTNMVKAERAMLRKADDEYRKTIFNAQVYLNSGVGTLDQAVDMATKDFLSRGIACIQYKNGATVTIDAYARMALRTAETRAYLQGESAKRDEWGITTVLVTRRSVACPKCIKYVGRVFYDDVFGSIPIPTDGKYPKLSEAMAGGLYHPNCKDIHTTYFEGVTEIPKPLNKQQIAEAENVYNLEQEQRYDERNIRKYKRLAQGSTNDENRKKYKEKVKEWQQKNADLIDENPGILRNRPNLTKAFPMPPKINAPKTVKTKKTPKTAQNVPKSQFIPAKTIEEAEEYIKKYVDASQWGAAGVSYSGVSLEVANKLNNTLSSLMEDYGTRKFGGIIAPKSNSQLGKRITGATAAYSPVRKSFLLNRKSLKDMKTVEKSLKAEKDAAESILNHPERYDFEKLSLRTRRMSETAKVSGRFTVPETLEDVITHEFGHFLEPNVRNHPEWSEAALKMPEFAPKISAYAAEEEGEYIAESLAAYRKGEKIEPTLKGIFDSLRKK